MPSALLRDLERICPGHVLTPGHPEYDATRLLFNGMYDRRPAVICLPGSADEVRRVVMAAREDGIATAVRGGGHNVAGSASVDDGLVIDLRRLSSVTVDPAGRTAVVGGGATWAAFDAAASAHGLATTGGTFDTTGVAGLTLGGGIGHLMGRHGLACDNVLSYTLIDAEGDRYTVDPGSHPDLDWALRGAGHNFGVVDELRFRLHPVSTVHGGYVAWSGDRLAEAVRLFRDLMLEAPDDLTCTLLLERHGPRQDAVALMSVCYLGDDEEYTSALHKRLRSLEVVDWQVHDRPYLEVQGVLGRLPFGLRHHWSARCVDALPDELSEALAERFLAGRWQDPFNDTVLIEPLHGAVKHGRRPDSAVPFRGAAFNITGMAIWQPPGADEEQTAWARSVARATEPWNSTGDGYINYVSDANAGTSMAADRLARTYGPEALRRLRSVKRAVDPDNFFRSNYNLAPAAPAGPAQAAGEAR